MEKTLFFLEVNCVKNRKKFYIRHDWAADDTWVKTYGVTELPAGETGNMASMQVNYRGIRTGPQYKCPYCGNRNMIQCGKCGEYTCFNVPDNSKTACCANCGEGKLSGEYIDSVESQNTGHGQ